ncbi:MAG TPA: TolC family protein, partial [Polyangiaceae bacterium]|nr:TolC family protein [Polyangiaceae bacterium]
MPTPAQLVSNVEPIDAPSQSLSGLPVAPEILPQVDGSLFSSPQIEPLRLTLFDAIETGLLQNPDLTAQRQAEGVSVGALGVARTYPFNPFLQITATPIQQSPDRLPTATYHYVLVMQTLQLAHQQRYREEIGMAALTSVRWNILQAELNNIAQTERLYFTAAYLRGVREVVAANAAMNEELLGITQRQLEAGQAAGADVAIVRLDTGATRRQERLAEANYQTALLDLRRQLNIPLSRPIEVVDDLSQFTWLPGLPEQLLLAKCPGATSNASAM